MHKRARKTCSEYHFNDTNRSSSEKPDVLRTAREMPQQLAIALASHQAIRSKEIVNFLHGFGMLVEYNRFLRAGSQIEKHVLQRVERNDSIFILPDVVPFSFSFRSPEHK